MSSPYQTHLPSPLVDQNSFRARAPETLALPLWADAKTRLPEPWWDGHDSAVACWWKAWELAWAHLRQPAPASGFVSNYIDTAFNGCLFLWDSVFILRFGRYGEAVFPFHRTLDNFYARQHPDGFICREIDEADGQDRFERFDPSSTGPNLFAWAEREHFRASGDTRRLAEVLPALLSYHRWMRTWRTWQDGSSWSTGWGCGMDNQPRMGPGFNPEHDHGHLSWADATLQQLLSARCLLELLGAAGGPHESGDLVAEVEHLTKLVNRTLWNEAQGFVNDRRADGSLTGGSLTGVKSVGAFWALLAGALGPEREDRLVATLEDPAQFARPHRVPSLSADHELYRPYGDYWRGSVWAPTTYMVLCGLRETGRRRLAREIGLNHHANVVGVFETTGTLWENWAPEHVAPGQQAAKDFVGWGGLPPIAVLLEFVFGLEGRVGREGATLRWEPGVLEGHGVKRYPLSGGLVDLACEPRTSRAEKPKITVTSTVDFELTLCWDGGEEHRHIAASN